MKVGRVLAAVAATAAMAAGCSSSGSSPSANTSAGTASSGATSAPTQGGHLTLKTTDPCALLTAQQAAAIAGGGAMGTTPLAKRHQPGPIVGASTTHDEADIDVCVHSNSAHGSILQLVTMNPGHTTNFATSYSTGVGTDVSSQFGVPAMQNKNTHLVYAIIDNKHVIALQVGGTAANSVDAALSLRGMAQVLDNLR